MDKNEKNEENVNEEKENDLNNEQIQNQNEEDQHQSGLNISHEEPDHEQKEENFIGKYIGEFSFIYIIMAITIR